MKVLVIHGSPRKNKNTDQVINAFFKEVKDIILEHVYLYDLNISYCTGCLACGKNGICPIEDDMQTLYELFETADAIVLGSPMYFNSVTSATKVMIDRTQVYWSRRFMLEHKMEKPKLKKGVFISTAGVSHTEASFEGARKVVSIFFKAINTSYDLEIVVDNLDHESLENQMETLQEITHKGLGFFS
ncbi:MAG: flavodoxin family protein [Clostridia bacterium]|nr:flavodoxin family protein [Clostridia bacterium]